MGWIARKALLSGINTFRKWSASIKGAGLSLDATALIATRGATGWQSLLATIALPATGLYTFTITTTGGYFALLGLGNTSIDVNSYVGATADSICVNYAGDIFYNGTVIGSVGFGFTAGDVADVQVDCGAKTFKVRKNGGSYSIAIGYAAIPGAIYPASGLFDAGSVLTAAF